MARRRRETWPRTRRNQISVPWNTENYIFLYFLALNAGPEWRYVEVTAYLVGWLGSEWVGGGWSRRGTGVGHEESIRHVVGRRGAI